MWLRRQGLTQAEIARQLGVSQQHVSRLLRVLTRSSGTDADSETSPDRVEMLTSICARLRETASVIAALDQAFEARGARLAIEALAEARAKVAGAQDMLLALQSMLPLAEKFSGR
jgi:transcriptional regulator with XRE-family HTH domain